MSPIDPAEAEALLREQVCPICRKGPWRVVAGHVWRKHGVDGRQLREMAGLPWSAKISDPEHQELMAGLARDADRVSNMVGKHRVGIANEVSPAGRDRLRSAGLRTATERRRKIPVADYTEIRRRLAAGESAPSIARQYGVTPQAVRFVARKEQE